jgi:hypothetical protein
MTVTIMTFRWFWKAHDAWPTNWLKWYSSFSNKHESKGPLHAWLYHWHSKIFVCQTPSLLRRSYAHYEQAETVRVLKLLLFCASEKFLRMRLLGWEKNTNSRISGDRQHGLHGNTAVTM